MSMVQEQSFEEIVRDTHAAVRAYIAGMGIATHEVDDVAQEVFLELYKNFEKMPDEVQPIRWLKGIARNLCLNHIRKLSRRGRLHRQALVEILARTQSDSEESFAHNSLPRVLESCCEKLPEKSQRLLALKYARDLTSAKIAQQMEMSAEAVRISLFRIRARLKDCISSSLARERWR